MRIAELFEYVDEILENPFSTGVKLRWLNQVEAEIQMDVLLLAAEGVTQYTEEDMGAELIVPPPYDNLYAEWLFWRICLAQQEAELANNYAVTYDRSYNAYVRFVCSTINPKDGMAEAVRYYLTAYQLAVKHGFVGTEPEWIESLKGPEGEPGTGVELKGVKNSVAELPETAEPGTSYLVGNKENNHLYVYDGGWNDMGPLRGATGPEGKPGEKGEPFTYEDFTPEQLESLKGDPFTYDDFTPEQLEGLRGESGVEISETEPVDPDVDVWINPNGEGEQPLYYSQLQAASEAILAQAKASGEFDGAPGKDGEPGQPGQPGTPGKDGSNGKDGASVTVSSVSESTMDGGTNVVTFSDGKTLNIKNGKAGTPGKDGTNGKDGKDGYTPQKGVDYFDGEDGKPGEPGAPGKDGAKGDPGYTPQRGTDYWTPEDQEQIVNDVLAALTNAEGVTF